ncbi:MAG TPA: SIMPL domain-containing protein [Silvibacterium sp.]|nr:SIMPL domain-containing protein [Silvibacterium sp.]
MKSVVKGNAAAIVVMVSLLGFAKAQTISVDRNNRTIAVTASEKATTEADLAVVHIGFQVFGPDESSTYADGSKISNAIIDALNKGGIPGKAIESENQNLQRNMFHDPQESQMARDKRQFVLNQSWTVKTRPDDAAKVLHAAVEAGANQSGQIDWQYSDMNGLQAKAAANALAKAQAIAQQMAQGLNVKLAGLIFASNQAPESPVRPLDRMGQFARMAAPAMAMAASAPLAINPRQIETSATVYAVFAIE